MSVSAYLNKTIYLIILILCVELTGPGKRVLTGQLIELCFTAGIVIVGGLAYFVRNWQYLQLAISLPGLLFISYYWFAYVISFFSTYTNL
jgi:hypothetical protein